MQKKKLKLEKDASCHLVFCNCDLRPLVVRSAGTTLYTYRPKSYTTLILQECTKSAKSAAPHGQDINIYSWKGEKHAII